MATFCNEKETIIQYLTTQNEKANSVRITVGVSGTLFKFVLNKRESDAELSTQRNISTFVVRIIIVLLFITIVRRRGRSPRCCVSALVTVLLSHSAVSVLKHFQSFITALQTNPHNADVYKHTLAVHVFARCIIHKKTHM